MSSTGGRAPSERTTRWPCAGCRWTGRARGSPAPTPSSSRPSRRGPTRRPPSASARLTPAFSVCAAQPISCIETIACQREPCRPSFSSTRRAARSRTSGKSLFGVLLRAPSCSGIGASGRPGAVQCQRPDLRPQNLSLRRNRTQTIPARAIRRARVLPEPRLRVDESEEADQLTRYSPLDCIQAVSAEPCRSPPVPALCCQGGNRSQTYLSVIPCDSLGSRA